MVCGISEISPKEVVPERKGKKPLILGIPGFHE